MLTVPGPGGRRRRLRVPFVAATLFFTVFPFLSLLANPPQPAAFVLLVGGWAIFVAVIVALFRGGPFSQPFGGLFLPMAVVAMIAIAVVVQVAFGIAEGSALYFYAGVTAARLADERLAIGGIAAVGIAAPLAMGLGTGDWESGVVIGVTAATISLTLFALARLGRANRELQAARRELADARRGRGAGADRARPPRHPRPQPVGHRAQERARAAASLADDPARAAAEIGDVERVAREALASVRDTVQRLPPAHARDGAGRRARSALTAAGIDGDVEPAPEGLPREVDAVLGWAVREGVTNVLRHSDAAAAAHPRHRRRPRRAPSRSRTTGGGRRRPPAPPDGARAGTGLAGLRERAAAVGGSLEAGPRPDGGFRLRVSCRSRPPADRRVIRVLLAEDQAMVRGALAALLALERDLEVVAEVGRGDEVVPRALDTRPGRRAARHRDARPRRARGGRPAADRRARPAAW